MKDRKRLVWISAALLTVSLSTHCDSGNTMGNPPPDPPPETLNLTDASPKLMKNGGGTAVTLKGTGFKTGATVTIGGVAAQDVVVVDSSTIQLKSPLKAATCGTVTVVVTNPDGNAAMRGDLITFLTNRVSFGVPNPITMGTYPRQVLAVDLNKDGKVDLVSANSGQAAQALVYRLGNGDGTFGNPTSYTAGSSTFGVAAVDLNKDGNLDLVTANSNSNDISVRVATGAGTFPTASTQYGAGADTRAIAAADLTGDGAADLVAVNYGSGNISIYKNNGDGTFAAQSNLSVGASPQHVILTDLDKDGKLDVVTANANGNNLSVRLANGTPSIFGAAASVAVGSSPWFVTAADWNGDGKMDLAVVNNGMTASTYMVSILLGDGKGSFATPVNIDIGNQSAPRGAVATDLNKDGIMDLVVAGYGSNTLPVLIGKGDGTFEPVLSVTGPAFPQSVDAADFDGDGMPDLVATSSSTGSQNVATLLGQCK